MKKLLAAEWRMLLFGFLMTFWSAPGQTFFIALFSGEIRADLGLSHGQFGAYYSLSTLLSAVLIVWTGPLIDKIDLRHFSAIAIFGTLLGCFLLSLSNSVFMLVLSVFLLRHFGQGLAPMTSSTSMVRYLDTHKGKANALASMGYRTAEVLLPSLVLIFLAHYSWRIGLQVTAMIMLTFILPLIYALLRQHPARHERYRQSLTTAPTSTKKLGSPSWTRQQVLKDIRFYLVIPAMMSSALLFTGFIFHQIHLAEYKGWSLSFWGAMFAFYGLISMLSALLGGLAIDRYTATKLVPWIPIPLALALLILSSSNSPWAAGAFLGLMAITVGIQTTASGPYFSEMYGSEHLGAIKSLVAAAMVFTSALSPALFGWLLDRGVNMDSIAMYSTIYVGFACTCAYFACNKQPKKHILELS